MPILAFHEQSAISAIGDGLSQQQLGSNFCVRRRRTPRDPGPPAFSIRGFSLPSPLSGARDLTTIGLGIPSKKCSLAQVLKPSLEVGRPGASVCWIALRNWGSKVRPQVPVRRNPWPRRGSGANLGAPATDGKPTGARHRPRYRPRNSA